MFPQLKHDGSVADRTTTSRRSWTHAPRLAAIALTLGVGASIAATAATAATPSASGGRIYACATHGYGTLNLSAASRRCPAGQHKVSWKRDTGRTPVLRTGARGVSGKAGASGAAGQQGLAGRTGEAGVSGAAGLMGAAGMPGAMGVMGATGPDGVAGPAATSGADGPTGPSGPVGATGAAGSTGPSGAVGQAGADGHAGSSGPAGPTGPIGATGARGPAGPQGEQGSAGAQGDAGAAGASAPADYGYVFNEREQVVEVGADVVFDGSGVMSPSISHEPDSARIQIDAAGMYEVRFSVSGTEPNQFGLAVRDEVVRGSTYGSGAGTQQNTGSVIVAVERGDALTLRNTGSDAAVTLAGSIGGKRETVNASVTITRLPDPGEKPKG